VLAREATQLAGRAPVSFEVSDSGAGTPGHATAALKSAHVSQLTSNRFEWVYERPGLKDGFLQMPESFPLKEDQAGSRRWLITAFLIYAAMIGSVVAYTAVHPDGVPGETQVASARPSTASKPARYAGVIANWSRYRRDARAEAR
jgi:hypothetical protein